MRVIGLDPGLRRTGWGIIEAEGNRLCHVANGLVAPDPKGDIAGRLVVLHEGLAEVLAAFAPDEAAVEITLANRNPASTLKLGMARGTALLTAALGALPVAEYLPMVVKRAVVGTGRASKDQVAMMVERLLPGCAVEGPDAADALAVAICHAHTAASARRWAAAAEGRSRAVQGSGPCSAS
ncbi:MAG: crossover junction endodeoxyribonuclease RuvC [Kiloniellaceae bacterium]